MKAIELTKAVGLVLIAFAILWQTSINYGIAKEQTNITSLAKLSCAELIGFRSADEVSQSGAWDQILNYLECVREHVSSSA